MEKLYANLCHYRHIIWDWNGTLFNDVVCCYEVLVELMSLYKVTPEISFHQYLCKFSFPVIDYYKDIGFDFTAYSFHELAIVWHDLYQKKARDCQLYYGTTALLGALQKNLIASSILTAAKQDDVCLLLDHFAIKEHFTNVYGVDNNYAHGKLSRGELLLEKIALPKQDVVMVGDTDHDAEVASHLGIAVILLADGHQDSSRWQHLDVATYARFTHQSASN